MKKHLLSSLVFISTLTLAQESGRYRNSITQNEVNVVVGEQAAEVTGWDFQISFPKNTEGQYVSKYGAVLEKGKDRSLTITGQNCIAETFNLYAPLTYTLPDGVKEYKLDEKTYFYRSGVREEGLVGEYLYEGKGEPKVLLSADGAGYFQRHMVPADELEWWGIETDYKGEIQKVTGDKGKYKLIIAMKYKNGKYDRAQVVVNPEQRKTYFLGERILSW